MKVYISADLEGIAGVVDRSQLGGEGENYRRACWLMTGEVDAAARGAFDGGAGEVLVNDSHGPMTNIYIEELHEDVKLISGSPKDWSMMAGIFDSCDLAMFIGYHARQGVQGTLSHTYSSATVAELKLNGEVVGELGLSAYIAGYFNVPVGLVSGDDALCSEAKELLGERTKLVTVKKNLAHRAAESLTPAKAWRLIREQAAAAVREKAFPEPLALKIPVTMELTFQNRGMAEAAASLPEAELTSGITVKFSHPDLKEVIAAMGVMVTMAQEARQI
ncbi:MAG: M55 family metallopeptidase [Bacillota bacterium]